MADEPFVHWTLEMDTDDERYWWSGEGDLTFEGNTYKGTTVRGDALIDVSPVTYSVDAPDRRATVRMIISDAAIRNALSIDVGIIGMKVNWIRSTDNGRTWAKVGRSFFGRLSSPVIAQGIYTAELETYLGDADRGSPIQWSDEVQQKEYPGDRGLEFARSLADGFEYKWPP